MCREPPSAQAKHVLHIEETLVPGHQPTRRTQCAIGESQTAAGLVCDLDTLADAGDHLRTAAERHAGQIPWAIAYWSAVIDLQQGEYERAIEVLSRGAKVLGDADERLKINLLALQNDKKMKMKSYGEQWRSK